MKKNAPKILAVVLLSAIAVLMIVAGSGSLVEVFNTKPDNSNNIPIVDAVGDSNNQLSNGDTANPSNPENDDGRKEEINYFPIKAENSANHRYIQTLDLNAPLLNATHSTVSGTFIIFTHQTESGAFKVPKRTQSIIKMDEEGTILSCYSISTASQTEYAHSKVTTQGLVVAVKDNTKTYLYTISFDFKQVEVMELPYFSSLTIFALSDSFLVFGVSSENVVYKVKNNAIVSSNVLQSGIIKEVYDFSTYYAIFSSGIDGYSFIKLSTDLKVISSVSMQNKSILAVAPLVDDGEQKFIIAEHTVSGVEIAKYDSSFTISNCERVGVGLAESAKVFINGESIFLLLSASTDRLYLVDKELGFTSSNNTTFQGFTKLYDCALSLSGYLVLYEKGETLTLTDIRNDGTIKSVNLDKVTASAFISTDTSGNYAVTYQTDTGIVSIGIN